MRPDDIHEVVRILKRESRRWPVPALAKYVETPFTVLISCILSLRTQDKTTLAASDRLFAIAATPESMLAVPVKTIEQAIYPVSFYRTKARTLHAICEQILSRHDGSVPSAMDALLDLPGVGRKTANIVVTLAFQKPGIAVDTHVHRISNRLGYVRSRTPEQRWLCGENSPRSIGLSSMICSWRTGKTIASPSVRTVRPARSRFIANGLE
jgi:endonuclease III